MFVYGLIDIDDFTLFNLKNGFELGNEVLAMLEKMIQISLSPIVCQKLNGDGFIFCLNNSFEHNLSKLLGLISKCESELGVTISVGIIESKCNHEFKDLINGLLLSLVTAKMNGKNKLCLL